MSYNRNIAAYRDYLILMVLIIISLIIISSNQNRQIEYFKMWMVGLLGSVQEKWSSMQDYVDLRKQNEQLISENTRLALENSFTYEMRLENERLRQLIGFKENNKIRLVPARVIGRGPRRGISSIVLDVGLEDSVAKNMPLVVADGLIGKLYQIGKKQSLGHLLVDQNFQVSGKIQRSRVSGIISWGGIGDICLFREVPKRSDVQVADTVITSGYGEIFPPGLRIGQVISAIDSRRGLFMEIKVKPFVDFEKIEEAFVIVEKKRQE